MSALPSKPGRSTLVALSALLAAWVGTAVISELVRRLGPGARAFEPIVSSAWIAAVALVGLRLFRSPFTLLRGGRRVLGGMIPALALTALALLVAFAWPAPNRPPIYARTLERMGLVLLVPLAEELLFRGLVLGELLKATRRPVIAALLVSLVFGLFHLRQGYGIMTTMFVLSGIFCLSALLTRSVLPAVAAHMAWNTAAAAREIEPGAQRWTVVAVGLVAVALLAALAFARRGGEREVS